MKTLFYILLIFFISNSIPAFSDSENPLQGATAIPTFYTPENPVGGGTSIRSGADLDLGSHSSSALLQKAWSSLDANNLKAVESYVHKIDELYAIL